MEILADMVGNSDPISTRVLEHITLMGAFPRAEIPTETRARTFRCDRHRP